CPPQAQEVVSRLLASGYKLVPASEWDDQIHQPAPGLSGPPAGTAPRQLPAALAEPMSRLFDAYQLLSLDRSLPLLDAVIDLARAVLVHPEAQADPLIRAAVDTMLGLALLDRYKVTQHGADGDAAIAVFQGSLAALPPGDRMRPEIRANLALAFGA